MNTMLSMGPGDYATLGGSVLPLDNVSSHSQQVMNECPHPSVRASLFSVGEPWNLTDRCCCCCCCCCALQVIEAALGFQGCTFQVPDGPADTTELLRARSELRMNQNGQPEFISELM